MKSVEDISSVNTGRLYLPSDYIMRKTSRGDRNHTQRYLHLYLGKEK